MCSFQNIPRKMFINLSSQLYQNILSKISQIFWKNWWVQNFQIFVRIFLRTWIFVDRTKPRLCFCDKAKWTFAKCHNLICFHGIYWFLIVSFKLVINRWATPTDLYSILGILSFVLITQLSLTKITIVLKANIFCNSL